MKLVKFLLVLAFGNILSNYSYSSSIVIKGNNSINETSSVTYEQQYQDIRTYYNSKYGFRIKYPADVFSPLKNSETSDGIILVSNDGLTKVYIYKESDVMWNGEGLVNIYDLQVAFNKDIHYKENFSPYHNITYKFLGKTFYVIAGKVDGNKSFYKKTIALDNGFASFMLICPTDQVNIYGKIIEDYLFKSFKY